MAICQLNSLLSYKLLMNKRILLARRPVGIPVENDFLIVTEPLSTELSPGEVLIKIR